MKGPPFFIRSWAVPMSRADKCVRAYDPRVKNPPVDNAGGEKVLRPMPDDFAGTAPTVIELPKRGGNVKLF